VAELLPALKTAGPEAQLPAVLQAAAADLVPSIVAARLTRGKGGEVMRPAICRLVQASAAAGLPLSDQQQQCLLGQLHENLRHATPEVQAAAAAALSGFAARYLRQAAADEQQQLVRQFTAALSDAGNVTARRGGALALGALPCWMLAGQQAAVLAALAAASVPEELADERDAEARVNAVKALAAVALTLLAGQAGGGDAGGDAASQGASNGTSSTGNGISGVAAVALSAEAVRCASEHVLVPLLAALDDYSIDNRCGAVCHCGGGGRGGGSFWFQRGGEHVSVSVDACLSACDLTGCWLGGNGFAYGHECVQCWEQRCWHFC
jgi:hypothetical protein